MQHSDHIDIAMRAVRAMGPIGINDIADEIETHVVGATAENCVALAQKAIEHGLSTGWLAQYDDIPDAYVMA